MKGKGSKKIFEGLGPGTLVPQRGRVPLDDPQLGPEEGFVLSRIDGRTSLQEICLLVPFDEAVTMVILRRLWEIGAIEVPGVSRVLKRSSSAKLKHIRDSSPSILPPPADKPGRGERGRDRDKAPPPQPNPKAPEPVIEALPLDRPEDAGLSATIRRRVDDIYPRIDDMSPFELLEIDRGADSKAVKRAYFKLSKEFHPDRYFSKELGDYRDKLSKIFQAVKSAFELLSDDNRRRAYEESADRE